MHYSLRAVNFEQNNHEMFNFGSWFLCHISSNTWIFGRASFYSPKIGKPKNNVTNISLGSVRLKNVNGVKIFVFTDAMIFPFITFVTNTPLWEKTLLNSEKMSAKYLTSCFGCCRRPNFWFVLREFHLYFYPSFKVCKWMSQLSIGNIWPDLHFSRHKCLRMTQSHQLPTGTTSY